LAENAAIVDAAAKSVSDNAKAIVSFMMTVNVSC
jgi:hypothetical protein